MLRLFNQQIQKNGLIVLGMILFFGLGTMHCHCNENFCIPALEDHVTNNNHHHCTASHCLCHLNKTFTTTAVNKENDKKQKPHNNTLGKITNLSTPYLSITSKYYVNPFVLHIYSIKRAFKPLRAPPVFSQELLSSN